MNHRTRQTGFSAVELLITIFIAATFVFMGYQLYGVITQNNQEVSDLSVASNSAQSATQKLVHNKDSYGADCTALATNNTETSTGSFDQYPTEITVTLTCPNATELPNLRRVSATATYKGTSATHALYFTK